MSALEQTEIRPVSGVKIAQTAKGDPTVTVHVYVGATDEELATAREQAVGLYQETLLALGGVA